MESGETRGMDGALPLAEAAARLGLSRDALRMRIRRGKARGFKHGGQVFVWLDDAALAAAKAKQGPARHPAAASAAQRDGAVPPAAAPNSDAWSALAALQKEEIARLIGETERLNVRLDRHLEEMSEMRQMLQREQVLRQQEQALRRDVQSLLERLVTHPSLGAPLAAATSPESAPLTATEPSPATNMPETPNAPGTPETPAADGSLAEMLKQIGQSLREVEARDAARRAPETPQPSEAPGPTRPEDA